MNTDKHPDPSNALYRNEMNDFAHAMRLVMEQCGREKRLWAARASPEEIKECGNLGECLDRLRVAAERCLDEHAAAVRRAEESLARRWLECEDQDVRDIGAALLERYYTHLAV